MENRPKLTPRRSSQEKDDGLMPSSTLTQENSVAVVDVEESRNSVVNVAEVTRRDSIPVVNEINVVDCGSITLDGSNGDLPEASDPQGEDLGEGEGLGQGGGLRSDRVNNEDREQVNGLGQGSTGNLPEANSENTTGPQIQPQPAKPKPPKFYTNPFLHFCSAGRQQVKASNPNLPNIDVPKAVGDLWRSLSEAQKAPYVQMANPGKERYAAEKKDYMAATRGIMVQPKKKLPRKKLAKEVHTAGSTSNVQACAPVPAPIPVEVWMAILNSLEGIEVSLYVSAVEYLSENPGAVRVFMLLTPGSHKLWLLTRLQRLLGSSSGVLTSSVLTDE